MSTETLAEAIDRARATYPEPPWRIGWWRRDGRWGVEVTRRMSYARYHRIVTAEGSDEQRAAPPETVP
jgi:hypothetical protein